ncbi:MAG: prepilin-type N-terminal cleavage/methylation domain-containing protein [Acidobacteria bacterium]|nr:prepilin-type N-terminal cleavage/methylation domain-containing protein [Acidobacteriota bacterium]
MTNSRSGQKASGAGRWTRRSGTGFSLVEVVVVIAIILIIAAIAIPSLLRAKISVNEAAAVHGLRAITTAQVTYDSTYQQGYAPDLPSLGPPPRGSQASSSRADLIDEVLASTIRNGYSFVYVAIDNAGIGKPDQYTVNANPISPGQTGDRYFYVDQTGVIRWKLAGPADFNSTPVPQ